MADNSFKIKKSVNVQPGSETPSEKGDLAVDSASGKISYHDGATDSPIVTESHTATLTNKTIDADSNTISNLETDNLKAGVLVTDVSLATSDTEIPSALAVKTALEGQNEASEITFDPTGSIPGTNVQDAVEDVQSNLQAHVDSATAHDASDIVYSNTASGLTATQVQAAIDEVEGRVDTAESSLSSHTSASENVHGVGVGNSVVGTGTTQTLTNKTIDSDLNTLSNIVDANIKADAAIAYSKLELSDSITDSDISTSAAIARSKVANGTANHVIINDGTGALSSEAQLAKSRGGSGQDNTSLTFPATGTLATLAGTESLSNKTLLSPVVDDGVDLIEESSLASPSAGRRRLGLKTDGKLYLRDSLGNETAVGTGSGGGINYITNPDAEANTVGWSTYYDSPNAANGNGLRPTNGGGTGGLSLISWTRSQDSPLRGIADFVLAKTTSNSAIGEGVATDFTIDSADLAKSLVISFNYEVLSGTYTSTGDVAVYIVADPNGTPTVIQPAGYEVVNVSSGTKGKLTATFQTLSTTTSYRLCLHVPSSTSLEFSLGIDNVQVGPQNVAFTTPVTDPVSKTPSWSNLGFSGTSANSLTYWRVGSYMFVRAFFNPSAGTGAATGLQLTIPDGYTIDTSKLPAAEVTTSLGVYKLYDDAGGAANGIGTVDYNTSTTVSFRKSDSGTFTTASMTTADTFTAEFSVPIVGWSSSAQIVSDSSEGRVVASVLTNSSNFNLAPNTSFVKVPLNTSIIDTHGTNNTSLSRWVAPVSGIYKVSGTVNVASTNVLETAYGAVIYVNGSSSNIFSTQGAVATRNQERTASGIVQLNAGDYVELYFYGGNNNSTSQLLGNGLITRLNIERIAGNTTLLGGETVAARYTRSTSTNIVTDTIIDYATKDYDTHGAVTTGASWKFTAPVSGLYRVTNRFYTNSATAAAITNEVGTRLWKNGTGAQYVALDIAKTTSSTYKASSGSSTVRLLAGEYIDLRGLNATGQTHSISDSSLNYIEIERIGNY